MAPPRGMAAHRCAFGMKGGQVSLSFDEHVVPVAAPVLTMVRIERHGLTLPVLKASAEELAAHEAMLARIRQETGRSTEWEHASGNA